MVSVAYRLWSTGEH